MKWGCLGVSFVRSGITNVRGLAREDVTATYDFDVDGLMTPHEAIMGRPHPRSRSMQWMATGPILFTGPLENANDETYRGGDALCFADPFSASGVLDPLLTGLTAGESAAHGLGAYEHRRAALMRRALALSSLFRGLLWLGVGDFAVFLPGSVRYGLTRSHA